MSIIKKLDDLVTHVKDKNLKKTVAVANAQDDNSLFAITKAVNENIIDAILVGNKAEIENKLKLTNTNLSKFEIVNSTSEFDSVNLALHFVKENKADILMKGQVGTDVFLKAILDKEKGLLPPKSIMSYVCAVEIPAYNKLLFITDTAVIAEPDLNQKIAMTNYAVKMANQFGIEKPKVALIGAQEKISSAFSSTVDYAIICKMFERGAIKNCIIDGPLDIFLACDPSSLKNKNSQTPIKGEADILVFPSIEASNSFYKSLMLFAKAELAGLIQGTTKPVVVMSRNESEKSKFYCIALACLMSNNK